MRLHVPGLDPMTLLVGVLLASFLLVTWLGGFELCPWPYVQFGVSWEGVSHGKFWQLLTYALLHGNWLHLGLNVLMLWLIGGRIIDILGWRRWLAIVFFGVLAGGVLHAVTGLVLTRAGYQESHLIGVSAACFALLVALTTLSPESRMWPVPVSGKNLGLGLIAAELALWLMHPGLGVPGLSYVGGVMAGMGEGVFEISHACHFGGAVVGWWLARRLLTSPPTLEQLQQERAEREGSL